MKSPNRILLAGILIICSVATIAAVQILMAPDKSDSTAANPTAVDSSRTANAAKSSGSKSAEEKRKSIWSIYPQKQKEQPPETEQAEPVKPATSREQKQQEVFGIRRWQREAPSRLEKELDAVTDEKDDNTLWSKRVKREQRQSTNSIVDRFLEALEPQQNQAPDGNITTQPEETAEIKTLKRRGRQAEPEDPIANIQWQDSVARDGPQNMGQALRLWLQTLRSENQWQPRIIASNQWAEVKNSFQRWRQPSPASFVVKSAFIDLHSGPSDAYPVYEIIERGETATIINAKFDWYQIQAANGRNGWINVYQLIDNIKDDNLYIEDISQNNSQWALGLGFGNFETETMLAFSLEYSLNDNLKIQFSGNQVAEALADLDLYEIGLKQTLYHWRSSQSYVSIAAGHFTITPNKNAIGQKSRDGASFSTAIGIEFPIYPYFSVTSEFKKHILLMDDDHIHSLNSLSAGVLFKYTSSLDRAVDNYLKTKIDRDDSQLGFYSGLYAADHLSTDLVYGIYFSRQLNDRFFIELNRAQTKLSTGSLQGLINSNDSNEEKLSYTAISTAYKIFQGEMKSANYTRPASLYLNLGMGVTDVFDSKHFSSLLGMGVQIGINDLLTWNTNLRTHFYEDDLLGETTNNYNLELISGINIIF